MKKYNKSVVIGRFNPVMHYGHLNMVKQALAVSSNVVIVVGSSNKFPDVKNPVPAELRRKMIRSVIESEIGSHAMLRITITEVPDYNYNDEKWKTEVRLAVDQQPTDKIAIVGFEKDSESYWLKEFEWDFVSVEPVMTQRYSKAVPISNTFIRDFWLRTGALDFQSFLPPKSIEFIEEFTYEGDSNEYTDEFKRLHEERLMWDEEIEKFKSYPYPTALNCCTADAVVVCNNHILLIERKFAPGKGAWALPGGHKDSNETFKDCALRELEEEVRIKVPRKVLAGSIVESHLFDAPNRSAVFCKPTVAQYIILQPNADGKLPKVKAASDAKSAVWVPMHEIVRNPAMLFDDHWCIIQYFTGL